MRSMFPWAAALLLGAATCVGCAVRTRAYPVGYAEIYSGPVEDIYACPRAKYDGRDVYWCGGRWIYLENGQWYSYVYEPVELYRFRTTVKQAPPAPRGPTRYYVPEPVPA